MEKNLREQVYEYVRRIPKGKVATYGQIAEALGNRKLARAVGQILHRNPDPVGTPCYRVVNREGKLAVSFGDGGLAVQKERLERDGIPVRNGAVDLKSCQFRETPARKIQELPGQDENEILNLQVSVGWKAYGEDPASLRDGFSHSLLVLGAYEGGKLLRLSVPPVSREIFLH